MSEGPLESWRRLRSSGVGDGVIEVPSFPTDVSSGYGQIRFALGSDQEPRLLVPIAVGSPLPDIGRTGHLTVGVVRFVVQGKGVSFLDLKCTERSLDTVFSELVIAVMNRIAAGSAPGHSVQETVTEFRDLLGQSIRREVPDASIYGLVGELVVLNELTKIDPDAVLSWVGPFEERHDFRRGLHALEVKTSSRSDAGQVSISSVDQLAEPTGGSLNLIHVKLERSENGSLSVGVLYDELVARTTQRKRFEDAMSAVGCSAGGRDDWNRLSFNLEGFSGYQVVDGFPRVSTRNFIGNTIPNGILKVQYVINLNVADRFRLTPPQLKDAFRQFLA
jgi:hypothetical protein